MCFNNRGIYLHCQFQSNKQINYQNASACLKKVAYEKYGSIPAGMLELCTKFLFTSASKLGNFCYLCLKYSKYVNHGMLMYLIKVMAAMPSKSYLVL